MILTERLFALKKVSVSTLISCVLLAAAVTFTLTLVFSTNSYNKKIISLYERQAMYGKLEELDRIARYSSLYEIDEDVLTRGLIEGYLDGTGDSDAVYLTAAEYYQATAAVSATGLGIYTIADGAGYLYVYDVIEGSSGAAAGLQIGDVITAVNGVELTRTGSAAAQAAINGPEGSTVSLSLYRGDETVAVNAVCQVFSHIPASYSIRDYQIGYLRITEFNSSTYSQFIKAVNNMISDGVTGIVIDLRHTGGNDMNSALHCLDRLLPEGDLMSKTNRDGSVELVYSSDRTDLNLPIALLTDGSTSGPAELFAAAMRDFGRASLIGSSTAGNGTLKESFILSDGSAVILSTAYINSPKGLSFNLTGVAPDYSVSLPAGTDYEFYSTKLEDDAQFKKAYEVVLSQIDFTDLPANSAQ